MRSRVLAPIWLGYPDGSVAERIGSRLDHPTPFLARLVDGECLFTVLSILCSAILVALSINDVISTNVLIIRFLLELSSFSNGISLSLPPSWSNYQ